MKNIYPNELKKSLMQKLHYFYIFLGEDFFLLEKNQDMILNFAYKKGFLEKIIIDVEKNQDWKKIILFYKTNNLFFKKTTLVINFLIKKLNVILIQNLNKMFSLLHPDILIILKFNHLSRFIQKNKSLKEFKNYNIVSCFTPYNLNFINWIKYEIQEKKINIEEKAFFLLCKYYEGNTLFIYKILDMLFIIWPDTCITEKKIKKIIIEFFDVSPSYWINSIFQGKTEKSFYILNIFFKKKYNPIILVRSLQKDLLQLIHMKREKKISIYVMLEKYNIFVTRRKFFIKAFNKINNDSLLKAIQILVKIEVNIKKKYNNDVWNQLQELILILCN
ncbi:DNA polymerase III subunit delta [Buchnera aphidicola]|uniref:DNA polymerase III subunit delta n=1 Tax=Buchnera aphidicola TaxID=9 RepID=UPI0001ECFDD5|nr:DNA polymerase III subunit delta [Buchnera aphidicola]ADP66258.1 DNA polymerase III delta subunit [Buchnera aphidicola str. LL01 (Acyrthosiphon pisum)]ADP67417.1 DNA polymerase III delta subunit [Buchnera aphidicola str. JF99 (Acyrthosiphon pisum)]